MTAPRVRADYDRLAHAANGFGAQAEAIQDTLRSLRESVETLRGGDWAGTGAAAFYSEVDQSVFPTLKRLAMALADARSVTLQVSQAMKSAEDQAAAYLTVSGVQQPDGPADAAARNGTPLASEASTAKPTTGKGAASAPSGAAGPFGRLQGAIKSAVLKGAPEAAADEAAASAGGMPKTMPDPIMAAVYSGLPRQGGGYIPGAGSSSALNRWATGFRGALAPLLEKQAKLAEALSVLGDTMLEEGAELRSAVAKDFPKAVQALDHKTGGKVTELILLYDQYGSRARAADRKLAGANHTVAGMQLKHQAATAALEAHAAKREQATWVSQKEALEARIAARQVPIGLIVDGAVSIAGGGAAGAKNAAVSMAGKAVTEMFGSMSDAELTELINLEGKISTLETAIGVATDSQVQAELGAAKSELLAAFDHYAAAKTEARLWEKAQWGTLDQLAQLEKGAGTGTVFSELQDYNAQARWVAADVRQHSSEYLTMLRTHPFGETGRMAAAVGADIRHVNATGLRDQDWQTAARSTEQYLTQLEQWRQGELASQAVVQQRLSSAEHLQLVDDVMAQAVWAAGATVDDAHLNR